MVSETGPSTVGFYVMHNAFLYNISLKFSFSGTPFIIGSNFTAFSPYQNNGTHILKMFKKNQIKQVIISYILQQDLYASKILSYCFSFSVEFIYVTQNITFEVTLILLCLISFLICSTKRLIN